MDAPSAESQLKPPVYFLHIEKTGGTSLTKAIAALFPPADVFRNGGSISLAFLTSIERELEREILIAGHAQYGVAKALLGRARIITMLRDPEEQAVSHYFHARLDAQHENHADALRLSFHDYISRHPRYAVHQLWALQMAMSDDYYVDIDRILPSLPAIKRLLWQFQCVGVLDRRAEFCDCLSAGVLKGRPIALPHVNSAISRGVAEQEMELARSQYRALAAMPVMGKLIETERDLYNEARAVTDHHIRSAQGLRPQQSAKAGPIVLEADRFHRRAGVLDGGIRCLLAQAEGHLIYGPYVPVAAGRHEAEFHFDIEGQPQALTGQVTVEVVAGDRVFARRTLERDQWGHPQERRLSFTADTVIDDVEFRISSNGFAGGQLRFDGVSLHRARAEESPTR